MTLTSHGIYINFVPVDLIAQYRAHCVRRGQAMRDCIQAWIEIVVDNPTILKKMKFRRPRSHRTTFFYIRNIPPETKQMFLLVCRDNQVTMSVVILTYIQGVLDERKF